MSNKIFFFKTPTDSYVALNLTKEQKALAEATQKYTTRINKPDMLLGFLELFNMDCVKVDVHINFDTPVKLSIALAIAMSVHEMHKAERSATAAAKPVDMVICIPTAAGDESFINLGMRR